MSRLDHDLPEEAKARSSTCRNPQPGAEQGAKARPECWSSQSYCTSIPGEEANLEPSSNSTNDYVFFKSSQAPLPFKIRTTYRPQAESATQTEDAGPTNPRSVSIADTMSLNTTFLPAEGDTIPSYSRVPPTSSNVPLGRLPQTMCAPTSPEPRTSRVHPRVQTPSVSDVWRYQAGRKSSSLPHSYTCKQHGGQQAGDIPPYRWPYNLAPHGRAFSLQRALALDELQIGFIDESLRPTGPLASPIFFQRLYLYLEIGNESVEEELGFVAFGTHGWRSSVTIGGRECLWRYKGGRQGKGGFVPSPALQAPEPSLVWRDVKPRGRVRWSDARASWSTELNRMGYVGSLGDVCTTPRSKGRLGWFDLRCNIHPRHGRVHDNLGTAAEIAGDERRSKSMTSCIPESARRRGGRAILKAGNAREARVHVEDRDDEGPGEASDGKLGIQAPGATTKNRRTTTNQTSSARLIPIGAARVHSARGGSSQCYHRPADTLPVLHEPEPSSFGEDSDNEVDRGDASTNIELDVEDNPVEPMVPATANAHEGGVNSARGWVLGVLIDEGVAVVVERRRSGGGGGTILFGIL
ncbi:hypothetical protein NMY22_g3076 [Coprinellus aureogranulatus]|nr:hypothetical protein NMY22_g3076 [Coprinellus aureogranulatus]